MGRAIYNRVLLSPTWMFDKNDRNLDTEYMYYILMANKQKFDKEIKAGKINHFFELIFHYLNLNTLLSEHKVYDEYMDRFVNESLELFIENFKDGMEESDAYHVIKSTNNIYAQILTQYLKMCIEIYSNLDFFTKNLNVHKENNIIYLFLNIANCNIFEIWKVHYSLKNKFGNKIQLVGNIEVTSESLHEYQEYVKKYNSKNKNGQITESNTIGITIKKSIDTKKVAILVKDIVMLNKLFYGNGPFNLDILKDMESVLHNKKMFPYKLIFD